ncbi:hypothetical protein JCM10207_007490 [Rhodosporidiobolus poonsookiae]
MATIAALPAVIASLSSSLASLPASLTSVNLTQLSSSLATFSDDVAPALPKLAAAQQEQLLTNTTWLAAQTSQLAALTAQLPSAVVKEASHEDLLSLIQIGATRYDVWTLWSPDIWSITLVILIAVAFKVILSILLSRAAVRRAQATLEEKGFAGIDRELARASLQKPARAALGHLLNLVIGTVALVLQLFAWRLFVLGSEPIRFDDVVYFSTAMKILLIGYGCDLLFGDVRPEIWAHHGFTWALLFVGQLAVYETKSPRFFRMAQFLILQGTAEQSTYLAMVFYHLRTYLVVQKHSPRVQHWLLRASHALLVFTKYITFPQKLVPAIFALYWLGRMWNELEPMAWGRAWLGWSTMIITLLLLLQIKFCDDIFPLANHIGHKLNGGPAPSRQGPVIGFFARLFTRRSQRARSNSVENDFDIVEKGEGVREECDSGFAPTPKGSVVTLEQLPVLSRQPGGVLSSASSATMV